MIIKVSQNIWCQMVRIIQLKIKCSPNIKCKNQCRQKHNLCTICPKVCGRTYQSEAVFHGLVLVPVGVPVRELREIAMLQYTIIF